MDIVKVLYQLQTDGAKIQAELDAIAGGYKKQTAEIDAQVKVVKQLQAEEERLLQRRSASQNPTVIQRYTQKIDEQRKKINDAQAAVGALTAETTNYGKALDSVQVKVQKAFNATAVKATQKETSGALASALTIAGGLGIVTGISGVISEVKQLGVESVETAAKAEGIRTAFSRIGGEQTLDKLRKATRGATSDLELMQATLRAKNFGIAPELLAKGLELAGKVARTTGQDVTYLTDSFVDGLGRKSIRILDNLQISQVALQKEIKKTGDFNTAVGNIIDQKLAETGVVIDTTADKLARFTAGWANLKQEIGTELITSLSLAQSAIRGIFSTSIGEETFKFVQEKRQETFEKTEGLILDFARESEAKRTALLSASSDRIVKLNRDVYTTVTEEALKAAKEQTRIGTFSERETAKTEYNRLLSIKNRSSEQFKILQQDLQNEKQLNYDLRNLNKKTTEDLSDELKKRLAKERQYYLDLQLELRRVQSEGRELDFGTANFSDDSALARLNESNEEQIVRLKITFEKREEQIRKEILTETTRVNALITLKQIEGVELSKLETKRQGDIRALQLKQRSVEIENAKTIEEAELKTAQAMTSFTLDQTEEQISIQIDYTAKKIQLMREEGKTESEIVAFSANQVIAVEQLKKDRRLRIQKQENDELSALQAKRLSELNDQVALDELKVFAAHRLRQSQVTASEVAFEEERLRNLKEAYDKEVSLTGEQDQARLLEITKQEDKIAQLKRKQRTEERQQVIDQTVFLIDNINTVAQAALDGINQVIDARIKEADSAISQQEKRMERVKDIAEDGNAELLELEKKRLDDLTKQREKYVRAQQALAVVELVANTAVTVSKAAAQGGAAAGFTIAAALIALVAGLASARAIAGQAAFYKGGLYDGQGYTGDGNPRETSTAVGSKPYIYHRQEFIHNHHTTRKFRNIFEDVHTGRVDLREWQNKVRLFDMMKMNRMDVDRRIVMDGGHAYNMDMSGVEKRIDKLIEAQGGQEGPTIIVDKNGITSWYMKKVKRTQFVDALTR